MKSLLVPCLVLLAAGPGIVWAQPAGQWLFGSTGRGTVRWTEEAAGLMDRGGADFGWAVLPSRRRWRRARGIRSGSSSRGPRPR